MKPLAPPNPRLPTQRPEPERPPRQSADTYCPACWTIPCACERLEREYGRRILRKFGFRENVTPKENPCSPTSRSPASAASSRSR